MTSPREKFAKKALEMFDEALEDLFGDLYDELKGEQPNSQKNTPTAKKRRVELEADDSSDDQVEIDVNKVPLDMWKATYIIDLGLKTKCMVINGRNINFKSLPEKIKTELKKLVGNPTNNISRTFFKVYNKYNKHIEHFNNSYFADLAPDWREKLDHEFYEGAVPKAFHDLDFGEFKREMSETEFYKFFTKNTDLEINPSSTEITFKKFPLHKIVLKEADEEDNDDDKDDK